MIIFRIWPSPQSQNEKPYFWVFSVTVWQKEAPHGSGCQGCSAHLSWISLSSVHRDGSLGSQAQLATACCLHSCDGDAVLQLQEDWESQEMQGLSWKQGNHLGFQWGLGEFDLWSKSRQAFTLFMISVPLFFALLAQIILWVWVFVLGRNEEFYSLRKGLENMVTISLFPTGI